MYECVCVYAFKSSMGTTLCKQVWASHQKSQFASAKLLDMIIFSQLRMGAGCRPTKKNDPKHAAALAQENCGAHACKHVWLESFAALLLHG